MVPRFISRCALFLLLGLIAIPFAHAENPFPQAGVAYLVKTGDSTLWSYSEDKRVPPASLTKVMTALVVLERSRLDDVVVISRAAAAETGSRIHLRAGEKLLVGDLLAALLIKSANDAAHALADHVAGSEEKFAELMNQRAAELGLSNTHFRNSSGLDHPDHYSTAADMAIIAETAMANPVFRTLVSQEAMDIHTVGWERTFRLRTSNKLLGNYEGLLGVKTGFTNRAGPCLIALAERGGEKVLMVMLNSPMRWNLAPQILDQAFEYSRLARTRTSEVGESAREGTAIFPGENI